MNIRTIYWKLAYIGMAISVFVLDQTTKAWAVKDLKFGGSKVVISDFLSFTYAENPGIAFSMFDGHGDLGRWTLSGIAIIAALGVIYLFWRTPRNDDGILSAFALIFAGILGNMLDRLRIGYVIDFIDFQFGSWHYPTFNVADVAICIGAGLLIIDTFRKGRGQADKKPETEKT